MSCIKHKNKLKLGKEVIVLIANDIEK